MSNSFDFSDDGIFIVRLEWLHDTDEWDENNHSVPKLFQSYSATESKKLAEAEFDKLYRSIVMNRFVTPELFNRSFVITLSYVEDKSMIGINELVIHSVNESDPLPWDDLKDGLYRTVKPPAPPKETDGDEPVYYSLS